MLKILRLLRFILDSINEYIGRLIAWAALLLVVVVCVDVAFRYLLRQSNAALPELEWHLFSLIFLLGSGYTLRHNKHVRVDVLYAGWHIRQQTWLNLLGHVLLLVPFCFILIYGSQPFVYRAFITMEGSADPGGLPYRFLIKSAIPACGVLLLIQASAELLKCIEQLIEHSAVEPEQ